MYAKTVGRDARILGLILGLGDLDQPSPCHGYQNACVCNDCRERQRLQDKRDQAAASKVAELAVAPAQPWEPRPVRRHAA